MSEKQTVSTDEASEDDDGEAPEVEADLVTEKLRIDGICGVY